MKYMLFVWFLIYHSSAAAITASCGVWALPAVFSTILLQDVPSVTLAQLRASPYTLKVYADSKLVPIQCQYWTYGPFIQDKFVDVTPTPSGWQTIGTTYFLNLNEGGIFGTVSFEPCPVDGPTTFLQLDVVNKDNLVVRTASTTRNSLQDIYATWDLPATVDLGAAFAGGSLSRNLTGPVGSSGRLDITRPSEKGAHIRLGLNGFPVDTSSVSVPEGVSWSAHMDTSKDTPPGEYKATVTATLLCD